jgi:hypothetical protein
MKYNIGAIGPAGGFVFYDKGSISDGWQYLEAAPAKIKFRANWGAYRKVIATSTEVGTGKQNTLIIIKSIGAAENDYAAQRCSNLNILGFNDWYLPSKDELDLMYHNLKATNSYHFCGFYWSSSEWDNKHARIQDFSNGDKTNLDKNSIANVLAIRNF